MGWLLAAGLAFFITILVKITLKALVLRLRKVTARTVSPWDDLAVDLLARTQGFVIFVWLFYLAIKIFETNERAVYAGHLVVLIATLVQACIWGYYGIKNWKESFLKEKFSKDNSSAAAIGLLYGAIQGTFFLTIILLGLSNMGVDIAALLAGLGVGGIAVALAAQNVLGDLLASLSIVLDRPFVIGDFIVVGEQKGTVEYVGIKTTRLRSLSGEELVFSNKDLLESRVQNFKRMWERRVVQSIGVTYSTPLLKMKLIPGWIKEVIEKQPKLRFDRSHFAKYADSSLLYEFVFWVSDADYNIFMDLQQTVLFEIGEKFAAEEIEFAFPTQTIFVKNEK
ncbi:MAG: mechanosensitive ion channel family protein [Bacteriovoracia bacterium]